MGIPHQTSNKRYLLEKINQDSDRLIEFGLSGLTVTSSDIDYFKSKNTKGKIVW
jgi:PleD family two-component response regulator